MKWCQVGSMLALACTAWRRHLWTHQLQAIRKCSNRLKIDGEKHEHSTRAKAWYQTKKLNWTVLTMKWQWTQTLCDAPMVVQRSSWFDHKMNSRRSTIEWANLGAQCNKCLMWHQPPTQSTNQRHLLSASMHCTSLDASHTHVSIVIHFVR